MPYHINITPEADYVHVVVNGDASYANAKKLWHQIADACKTYNCFNVLGEQRLIGQMSTVDAWNHQKIFLEEGITSKYKIAWVDPNPKTYETTNFIRRVLFNRDIGYGKIFSDPEPAKKWLLDAARLQ